MARRVVERNRQSIRLDGHDYGGFRTYFVTLCTENRECLFGDVVENAVALNAFGQIARDEWSRSAILREELDIGAFVVMPNHLHAIVSILSRPKHERVGAHGRAPLLFRPPRSLGAFVAGFKASTTKRINTLRDTRGTRIWQRNYHERVIRHAAELDRIQQYIAENPARWDSDPENPSMMQGVAAAS